MKSIRRKDREIKTHEAIGILDSAEYGVLSTVGKDGQPYGVPLSFVHRNNCIYFHCALTGQKLDNIGHNSKVSFCVVGNTKVLPDQFGTEYESALAFGVASEVNGDERYNALLWILEKYCTDFMEEGKQYIAQKDKAVKVFKVEINHISGKARRC
ncbi:MAG TPA: pyridoxamine 5'-phosphate oxidase family protein [Dissulfurispiraceae bacterium]|nr:pyridoxamine 5'-phosphate oxidase family protein [Dissulfurispiraceae bacterium]